MQNSAAINLDAILEIALKGVRRASMFMGLGVNAALREDFNEYKLTRRTNISLLPDEIPPEQLSEAKDAFRQWIEANGFRELMEAFHVFLDAIYHSCLLFMLPSGGIKSEEIEQRHRKFSNNGLPEKIDYLNDKFGISPISIENILSLNAARNVMTHRRGIVKKRDLTDEEKMRVSWLSIESFIEESSGTQTHINEVIEKQITFLEETHLILKVCEKERYFANGAQIEFSSQELAEICWYMAREARLIISRLSEHAKELGIPFQENDS